jgi:hypothetical protein
MYGTIVPVPRGRVIETPHGMTLRLGGRDLLFLDIPTGRRFPENRSVPHSGGVHRVDLCQSEIGARTLEWINGLCR